MSILGHPQGRVGAGAAAWDAAIEIVDNIGIRAERVALHNASASAPNEVWIAPESEPDAKMNPENSNGLVLNVSQDLAGRQEIGRYFSVFADRMKIVAPSCKRLLWFAQAQKTNVEGMLTVIKVGDYHMLTGDPYFNETGGSFGPLSAWNTKWLTFIKANADYIRLGRPDLGITEFGMTIGRPAHTDAQVAKFIGDGSPESPVDLHEEMISAGVKMAIWFSSDRDNDHDIMDGEHPLSAAAFARNLARNTINGGGPTVNPGAMDPVTAIGATLTSLGDPDTSGTITENSGLVASNRTDGVWWGHNDQGTNVLYALDGSGTIRHELTVTGATNANQWEDIAWGAGNSLYVGRTGSGAGTTAFYKVAEPLVTVGVTNAGTSVTPLTFTYTNPYADAEAFFVDPISGDLFLFQKVTPSTGTRPVGTNFTGLVHRFAGVAALTVSGALGAGTSVGSIRTHQNTTNQAGITWADISRDGKTIVYGNLQEAWVVNRDPATQTVSQALLANGGVGDVYRWWDPAGGGSTLGTEGLALDRGNNPLGFATLSEGVNASLKTGTLTR